MKAARVNSAGVLFLLLVISSPSFRHRAEAHPFRPLSPSRSKQRADAVLELKRLVPAPSPARLGGEATNDEAYARFLSVNSWDTKAAAPRMEESLRWRERVKPESVRPRHCPTLCRQYAWLALTNGPGSNARTASVRDNGGNSDSTEGGSGNGRRKRQLPLDPPMNPPPLQTWARTRHGLPITYFRAWMWRPHEASKAEQERHMAYLMSHLIRRMPRGVSRICVVFDLHGFDSWMLSYIHRSVDILRTHYPGRAGAMVFINCPSYFSTVWRVISPWLDEEIKSKVYFAPSEVDDVDKAIKFVNGKALKVGPV